MGRRLPRVSKREKTLGILQTAANVAAGPVGKVVTKAAGPIAGSIASLSPVGAAYTPEDPLVGAITMPIVGKILHEASKPVTKVAKAGIGAVRAKVRARMAERAAAKPPEPPTRPAEATTPEAAAPVPPAPEIVPLAGKRRYQPGSTAMLPKEQIKTDPATFQYKRNADPSGAGGQLQGPEPYNKRLARDIDVWEDPATGEVYVVEGHNRHDKAMRDPSIAEEKVTFIDADTAQQARAFGAISNIAQGNGTAVDAAKFFRDTGLGPDEITRQGVSLKGSVAKNGVALSKLATDVFDQVASGRMSEGHGVIIGRELAELPEVQRTVATEISKHDLTDAEVLEVARQAKSAGTETVTQESLFGTEKEAVPLMIPRAKLTAAIGRRLREDANVPSYVTKGKRAEKLTAAGNVIDIEQSKAIAAEAAQLLEQYGRDAHAAGPIARQLTEAARRLVQGEPIDKIVGEIYEPIRQALREAGPSGAATTAPIRPQPAGAGETASGAGLPGLLAESERLLAEGERRVARTDEILDFEDRRKAGTQFRDEPLASPRAGARQPPSLFGEEPRVPQAEQQGLFGAKEGTAGARPLDAAIRASEAIIPKLREQLRLATDPATRQKVAAQLVEHEKIANHRGAITAEEVRAERIASGDPDTPTLTGQVDLFSPATANSGSGSLLRKMLGLSPAAQEAVLSLQKIGDLMDKGLDIATRGGRFKRRAPKARGVFFPRPEAIRVGRMDWLDVRAHEVGHYLSKKYLKNPTYAKGARRLAAAGLPPLTTPMKNELIALGKALYGGRKPGGGYGEEGIAEWTNFYVTDRPTLAAKAPAFTAWMDAIFTKEPQLKAILDTTHDRLERWRAAGPEARTMALITLNKKNKFPWSVRALKRGVLDDLEAVGNAEQLGADLQGKPNTKILHKLARNTRGAVGRADDMMENGIVLPEGDVSKSFTRPLMDAYRTVGPKRFDQFRMYLISHRTLEVAERGINTGQPVADAQAIVALYDKQFPDFKPAAEIVWENSVGLLTLRYDAGLITKEQFTKLAEANQRRVGLYRDFDIAESAAGGGAGGGGMVKTSSGVKSLHGSGRNVLDPLETMMRDFYDTVQATQNWHAARSLLQTALKTEGGHLIAQVVDAPREKVTIQTDVARRQILQQLQDMGVEVSLDADLATTAQLLQEWPGLVEGFRDRKFTTGAESKDLVFPMLNDAGKWTWVQVIDKALFETLTKKLGPEAMSLTQRLISAPARLRRAGATLPLEFAIARNPIRDAFESAIYSSAPTISPQSIPGYLHAEGIFHWFKKTDRLSQWKLSGGAQASMSGLDLPSVRKTLREAMLTPAGKALDLVRHPLLSMRRLGDVFESAPRLGEFAGTARRLEKERGTTAAADPDIRTEAGFGSRDLTIDFAGTGTWTREANRMVTFFASTIGGNAKMFRAFADAPAKTFARAVALITVPSILLYLKQRNDEAYINLPQWRKDLFWNYIVRDDAGKYVRTLSVPKAHLLALLFGSAAERIARWIDTDDPKAMDGFVGAIGDQLLPALIPTYAEVPFELWANKSLFRGRAIESEALQRQEPGDRAYPWTGETARVIGEKTNLSPAKLEHLVSGTTAGIGRYGMGISDFAVRQLRDVLGQEPLRKPQEQERDWVLRVPGLKALVARRPGRDASTVTRFYETFDKAEQARSSWKNKGTKEARARYLRENRETILSIATQAETGGESGILRRARAEMDKLQGARRALEHSAPPSDSRRAQLDQLDQRMIDLARTALAAAGDKQALYDELHTIGTVDQKPPKAIQERLQKMIGTDAYQKLPKRQRRYLLEQAANALQ